MTKVIMFASNFSGYGKIQAMKSTLEYLTKDAGHRFVFVNDPERGNVPKVKFGTVTVNGLLNPLDMGKYLSTLEDVHA